MSNLKRTKLLIQMTDGSTLVFLFTNKEKYSFVDSDSRSSYLKTKSSLSVKEFTYSKYKNLFMLEKK